MTLPRRKTKRHSLFSSRLKGISIKGFKSIKDEVRIDFHPLTIISGANSSGKSSIMQPLLMIKQTIESAYDQGPLKLNGENVKFTKAKQLFWMEGNKLDEAEFTIKFFIDDYEASVSYRLNKKRFFISQVKYIIDTKEFILKESMSDDEIRVLLKNGLSDFMIRNSLTDKTPKDMLIKYEVQRDRWFLLPIQTIRSVEKPESIVASVRSSEDTPLGRIQRLLSGLFHLPGLRGNPERSYPVTVVEDGTFPGVFPIYTASIIALWKQKNDARLKKLGEYLSLLGLTWKVDSLRLDDTSVELRVGRLANAKPKGSKDLVNIADVGVGVSQTLPLLVALLAAKKDQIVYIEQPEIHLHPRAQVALAQIIIDSAKRGVVTIIETHSNLVLRGLQEQVALGNIASEKTILHWFSRDDEGVTQVQSGSIDKNGRYKDWPEDFADVEFDIENRFMMASIKNG